MIKNFSTSFCLLTLLQLCGIFKVVQAQQFNGTNGSVYTPIINTTTQPASGADMPYRWGIEVAGINSFWNNNIVSVSPAKLNWNQDTINVNKYLLPGKGKRQGVVLADAHLLNFLFPLPGNEQWVLGGGWNIRSQTFLDQFDYDYNKTMSSYIPFLEANAVDQLQKGRIVDQQWTEWFLNASTLLKNNKFEKLSAGVSLKLIKGLTGVIIDIDGLRIDGQKNSQGHISIHHLVARYGYSKNLEDLNENQSANKQLNTLLKGSPVSLGLDMGFIYTRKKPVYIAGFTNDEPTDYEWRISVALTDMGRLKYPLGSQSRIIKGSKGDIDLNVLEHKFKNTTSLSQVNDSLAQMMNMQPWEGASSISLPTALRINFDRNLNNHFFINTNLVLDASFLNPGVDYKSHTLSYLTVTPRWEKKRIGFYAPLYLNVRGSFMAGAAFRLGPLVAGVHDFGWLFGHKKSGGAYVSLILKSLFREKEECPTF